MNIWFSSGFHFYYPIPMSSNIQAGFYGFLSKDYFESDDFNTELNTLKSWMIQNNVFIVDGEDFESAQRNPPPRTTSPISQNTFYKITSSISDSLGAFEKTDAFSNTYIEYHEFTVRHIHGQGTITRLELDISKLRDNNINKIIL
jgi:hypothetical protein